MDWTDHAMTKIWENLWVGNLAEGGWLTGLCVCVGECLSAEGIEPALLSFEWSSHCVYHCVCFSFSPG